MPEVQITEIAWAAGIFDQGGYVREKNRTLYLRIWFPFDRARALRFRETIGAGKVYGPYKRVGNFGWQYELTGRAKVSRAIGMLRPYLTHPARHDGLLISEEAPPETEASFLLLGEEAPNVLVAE